MASVPTIPAPVAAPPVSAPAAPTPAPVVDTTPAPVTPPATSETTPVAAPPAEKVDAAPVVPVVTDGPAEPKAADFQDGGEFLSAHARWENEKAEFDKKKAADKTGEVTTETETEVEKTEEQKTEEAAKAKVEEPEVAPTPKELDDILKGDPDLAAALDKNGKAKGAVMKMARELAEAKPIKELFPGGVESAKFARETSREYVGLRSKFEAAVDDPAAIGDAFTAFIDQFTLVDAKGEPIKGADGKPQLAEDFNMLATHMAKLNAEGAMAELEERIATDKYASPEQKERDEQKLLAWKFLTEDDDVEAPAKPDYSALPEAERRAQEAKDAKIAELEAKLNEKDGTKNAEQKKIEKDNWNRDFGQQHGKALVDQTESIVKELRSAGQNIPQWMLNLRSPGSDVPVLYQNILNDFNSFIKADSYIFKQSKDLARLAPTAENLKTRVEYFNGLAKDHLRDIVKGQIKSLLKQEEPDAKIDPPNPSKEPVSSGVPAPATGLTMEDAFATAKVQLAKEVPNWAELDGAERNAQVMARARMLQRK